MAEFLNKIPTNLTEYPNSFKRQGAFPLDAYSVFYSKAEAETYAKSNPISYVGQTLAVVTSELIEEVAVIKDVTLYIIDNEAGNLKEVGSIPSGDDQSIEVVDGKIQIKGFGKGYWKYNEEVEGKYEFVENGFKAGLQPQIVAAKEGTGFEIAWYEPNPTTVEGLKSEVTALSGSVNTLTGKVDTNTNNITGLDTKVKAIEEAGYATQKWVEDKNYLTEHQDISGKVDKTDLNDYYTKEQADAAFMTEEEVDSRINEIIVGASDDKTITSLTALVDYIEAHGGEAAEMATAIEELEKNKADKTELASYAEISYVNAQVGANTTKIEAVQKDLADNYYTSVQVDNKLAGYQEKITVDNKLSYELIEGTPEIPSIEGLATTDYVDGQINTVNVEIGKNTSAIESINTTLAEKVTIAQVNEAIAAATIQADKIEGKVASAAKADEVAQAISFVVSKEEGAQPVEYNGSTAKTINIVEIVDNAVSASESATNERISAVEGRATTLESKVEALEGVNAQANIIEHIQVGGVEVMPDANKTVNITKFSTDLLVQGSKLLILDGGSASN